MASLSSKRKASVNRRVQQRDTRVDGAPKAAKRGHAGGAARASGAVAFDEAVYTLVKSRFVAAIDGAAEAGADIKQVMRVLVQQEFDDGGREAALKMQPYIVKFVGEYRDRKAAAAR